MERSVASTQASRELLRQAARRDHPDHLVAVADATAWARAEGEGSAAAAQAIKRTGLEARIPGLAARPTVMAMGWSIAAAVVAASVLSWFPASPWVEIAGKVATFGAAAVAVAAAAWGFLSEVRGWEGSDASRWLLKRRVKTFRKALDLRRRAICETLICVGDEGLVVYTMNGGTVVADATPAAGLLSLTIEPRGSHMSLRLATPAGSSQFDWLPRNAGFEAAVARLALVARGQASLADT